MAYPLLNGPMSPGKPNGVLHEGTMAFIKTISVREANDELLTRLAKEAIGVSVAQTNACHY